MYPKQFFIEQFSEIDSEHLLVKLSSEDLADNASDAIRDILTARGMSVTEIDSISKKVHKAQYRLARRTIECDFCGNSARHDPVLNEGQRFCSRKCLHRARVSEAAVDLTDAMILQAAGKIRSGACPVCSSMSSPVEMRFHIPLFHTSSRVRTRPGRAYVASSVAGKKIAGVCWSVFLQAGGVFHLDQSLLSEL